jgi:toxin ParE1/3/4
VAKVEFSNAAEADLVEIDEFSVVRFGEDVAEIYMHGFDAAFERLRDFPLVAPLRPEFGEGYRCLVHRQHRVFYTVSEDGALIVRILHHSRNASRALRGGRGDGSSYTI